MKTKIGSIKICLCYANFLHSQYQFLPLKLKIVFSLDDKDFGIEEEFQDQYLRCLGESTSLDTAPGLTMGNEQSDERCTDEEQSSEQSELQLIIEQRKIINNKQRTLSCNHCNKPFSSSVRLNNHIARGHKVGFKKSCDVCFSVFKNVRSLMVHSKLHAKKKCSCNMCNSEFESEWELQTHKKIHRKSYSIFYLNLFIEASQLL